jgi:hypothetical protein
MTLAPVTCPSFPFIAGVLILIMPKRTRVARAPQAVGLHRRRFLDHLWLSRARGVIVDGPTGPDAEQTRWLTNAVAICSAMICVMMFALGFGLLTPVSGAVSALADLIGAVRCLDQADRPSKTSTLRRTAAARVATLTLRQHEIMDRVIAGYPSKNIAADLGISHCTVVP